MSLLDNMMRPCTIMNKKSVSDGEGGTITTWEDGPEIQAIITHNTTIQAKRAEQEGVTSTYTITTKRDVVLDFHDVVKDEDNNTYRVTTVGGTVESPSVSSLDIAQVSAERWELTT